MPSLITRLPDLDFSIGWTLRYPFPQTSNSQLLQEELTAPTYIASASTVMSEDVDPKGPADYPLISARGVLMQKLLVTSEEDEDQPKEQKSQLNRASMIVSAHPKFASSITPVSKLEL
jgi:hypothetical protein